MEIEKDEEDDEEEEEEAPKPAQKKAPFNNNNTPAPATAGGSDDRQFEAFVRNLSYQADENALSEFFADCGEVLGMNILTDKMSGRPKGIAFVRFKDQSGLDAAVAKSGSVLMEREVYVEKSKSKEEKQGGFGGQQGGFGGQQGGFGNRFGGNSGAPKEGTEDSTTVFVGNLSYQTQVDTLRSFFESCGTVTDARISIGEDGRSRGFGHVEFADRATLEKALLKAGENVDGRPIKVDVAAPRKPREQREGGF